MDKKQVTNNGKKGGWLVGKRHYDKNGKPLGGIKAIVTDAGGRPVELEGGEVIINREASKKHWRELSRINQSAGNGVPINPPSDAFDEDPDENYKDGGKIEFNANHIPNKWILSYAEKIKSKHPEIWKLGGNIFGNEAFENLRRVAKRGYWLDSEEWMYIKWRSYVARHQRDYRIEGVVAMLKWVDKVSKGWPYMKNLIEEKIQKIESKKGWKHKMKEGGNVTTYKHKYNKKYGYDKNESHDLEQIHIDTGISLKGLQEIYNKGIGAYKTNPESVRPNVTSKEQWAMARVYSAVMGGKAAKIDANELKMETGGSIELLAPNGQPSKLNAKQWHMVRTPEFKAWFGDWEKLALTKINDSGIDEISLKRLKDGVSKVVDSNGEPLVVYHGTNVEFTKFLKTKGRGKKNQSGIYLSDNKNVAKLYGNKILECFVSIKNPFIKDYQGANYWELYGSSDLEITSQYNRAKSNITNIDGVIFYNIKDALERFSDSELGNNYIPFNSTQIKLADGTNTTFDTNNPDIRFMDGGLMSSQPPTENQLWNQLIQHSYEDGGSIPKWEKEKEYYTTLNTGVEHIFYTYKNAKIYYSEIDKEWLLEINGKIINGYPSLKVAKKRAEIMLVDVYKDGGNTESCIDYIKNSQSIKNNGYYFHFKNLNVYVDSYSSKIPKIKSLVLITFNSGGQSNLKVSDTINSIELSSALANLLNVDLSIARIIVSEQIMNAKRLSLDVLNNIKNENMVIADRNIIVCSNLLTHEFANGGSTDAKDTATIDIPLLIRLLELSREDIDSDAELHQVVERLLDLKNKPVLTMDDYAYIADIEHKHINKMATGGQTQAQQNKIAKVMGEFKDKKLYSSSGDLVKDRKQAIAIALSEAGVSKKMSDGGSIDPNSMEIQFIKYNGEEIMYEPHFKEFYVNDSMFNSLEEAKNFIDGGAPMSDEIKEAYRKGLFEKGGSIEFERPSYEIQEEIDRMIMERQFGSNNI